MFRIVCDPSSGSTELCLTEITRSGSQIFVVVCVYTVRRAGNLPYTHATGSKITLPNTDQAHDKYLWTTTSNFSQAQLRTPWWWITYDRKHVGVIFNFVSFKLFYNVDFNL